MGRLRFALLASLLATAMAAPATAQAQLPADVTRIQAAVTELSKAKRDAATRVAAERRAAERALASCRTKGRGWKRVRAIRDASQRNAYARGAKQLWKRLREVALEGAALAVYTPAFERFLNRLEAPFADPVLQAGADAHRQRLVFGRRAYSFGTCRTFNGLLKKVRQFKIGGRHGVAGDYYAGRIYNTFVRYVPDRQRAAARKHWGSRYDSALKAARERLRALGGDEGYATYFAFAHSIPG